MKSFHTYFAEAFEAPFPFKGESQGQENWQGTKALVYSYEYPTGKSFDVIFKRDTMEPTSSVELEFRVNGSTQVQNSTVDVAMRVFASVLDAAKRYLKNHAPDVIHFSASKDGWDKNTRDFVPNNRASLYKRMATKLSTNFGYALTKTINGEHTVGYIITKKK